MAGRNGNDKLNAFLLVCVLILLVLSSLLKGALFLPALLLLGFAYFRMLSKNVYRRQEENSRYLRAKQKVLSNLRLIGERWKQRKDYKFFVCPACRTTLRVPKGRGKIRIVCRKCGKSFEGRS